MNKYDELVCWYDGAYIVSSNFANMTISNISERRVCGLHAEGDIHCWWLEDRYSTNDSFYVTEYNVQTGFSSEGYAPPDGKFIDFDFHVISNIGLSQQGKIQEWGTVTGRFPEDIEEQFTSVIAGQNVSCALSKSGKAICYGKSYYEDNVPSNIQFKSIDVRVNQVCGISIDDRIYCWGAPEDEEGSLIPPEGKWRMLSVGGSSIGYGGKGKYKSDHACAIDFDGNLECWGCEQ